MRGITGIRTQVFGVRVQCTNQLCDNANKSNHFDISNQNGVFYYRRRESNSRPQLC